MNEFRGSASNELMRNFYDVLKLEARSTFTGNLQTFVKTLGPDFTWSAGGPDVMNRKPVESNRLPMNDEHGSIGVNLFRKIWTTRVDQVRLLHCEQQQYCARRPGSILVSMEL